MNFNAIKFLDQNKFDYSTTKQATKDWVQIRGCPFCGDVKYHFGMHKSNGAVKCWKCGAHGLLDSIKRMMNCSHGTAKGLVGVYSDVTSMMNRTNYRTTKDAPIVRCKLPEGTRAMLDMHREYLQKRDFDDKLLEKKYDLKGVGMVPGSMFNNRIIIPVYRQNTLVSYQARTIFDKHAYARYKMCRRDLEAYSIKKCLYAIERCQNKSVIVTEGVSKVWRLGDGAVATFGIQWLQEQAELLLKFDRVFILFDKGEQAQLQAEKLAYLVASYTNTEIINLDDVDDPGDMKQEDADALMKELKIR